MLTSAQYSLTSDKLINLYELIMQNKSRLNKWAKNANDPTPKNRLDHFSSVNFWIDNLKHSKAYSFTYDIILYKIKTSKILIE